MLIPNIRVSCSTASAVGARAMSETEPTTFTGGRWAPQLRIPSPSQLLLELRRSSALGRSFVVRHVVRARARGGCADATPLFVDVFLLTGHRELGAASVQAQVTMSSHNAGAQLCSSCSPQQPQMRGALDALLLVRSEE